MYKYFILILVLFLSGCYDMQQNASTGQSEYIICRNGVQYWNSNGYMNWTPDYKSDGTIQTCK